MVKAVLLILALAVLASLAIWTFHSHENKRSSVTHSTDKARPASIANHPNIARPLPMTFIGGSEWQEYHAAQKKTLDQNPDLAAEYRSILSEMAQQQKDLEQAMLKADPKLAPVLAKLDEIRQHNTAPGSFSTSR